jgi:hypothetical protein
MMDENEITVASETLPQPSGLELEIEAELADAQEIVQKIRLAKGPQAFDVASIFLCNARTFERAGKHELARRQLAAARNVLAGGKEQ